MRPTYILPAACRSSFEVVAGAPAQSTSRSQYRAISRIRIWNNCIYVCAGSSPGVVNVDFSSRVRFLRTGVI